MKAIELANKLITLVRIHGDQVDVNVHDTEFPHSQITHEVEGILYDQRRPDDGIVIHTK